MATTVFCCGFGCGVNGSVGQHWNFSGVAPTFETTNPITGARSLNAKVTASGVSRATTNATFGAGVWVLKARIKLVTLPSNDCSLMSVSSKGCLFKSSDSKLYPFDGISNLGSQGFAVVQGGTYDIDVRINTTANPHLIDLTVNGTALTQLSLGSAADTTARALVIGIDTTSTAGEIIADDVALSTTSGDYPLGFSQVYEFVPVSDGTHNVAGAGDFAHGTAGADITNSTTDAWTLVDDVPLPTGTPSTTDLINLLAPPNATDYVECVFGPASGVPIAVIPPRGVEVIAAIHQAGTGTGNVEIRLNDNGTNSTIYTATAVAGATTFTYKRAHFATPPTGGSWNANNSGNGAFNNLRVRFGSPAAVDANPDQYLDAIMIEAEFPAQFDQSMYTRPYGQEGQSLMQQLLVQ